MDTTVAAQGDLALLNDPIAQELLASRLMAQLGYVWYDGTPRVVPIWFHWDGKAIVMGSPAGAPKLDALRAHPEVAVTISSNEPPYRVLMLRGTAVIETVDGVVPEYAAAARRYYGDVQGNAWVAQIGQMVPQMGRVAMRPSWVGIIDFQTRFPSAVAKRLPSS